MEKKNEWFDTECEQIIKEKKEARLKWLATRNESDYNLYKEIRKYDTKRIKQKIIQWIERTMDEMENDNNNNTKIYQQIRRHNRKQTITSIKIEEWTEHFGSLLNEPGETIDIIEETNIMDIEEQYMPSEEEYLEIIKILKQNKATGPDDICNELIIGGGNDLIQKLYHLILHIWEQEKMPKEWGMGLIVPVFKKGDARNCQNYRGTTLLNTSYKIVTSLILQKLKYTTEMQIGEYQHGFRQGRSTIDAIESDN